MVVAIYLKMLLPADFEKIESVSDGYLDYLNAKCESCRETVRGSILGPLLFNFYFECLIQKTSVKNAISTNDSTV